MISMMAHFLGNQPGSDIGVIHIVLIGDDPSGTNHLRPLFLHSLFDGDANPYPRIEILQFFMYCLFDPGSRKQFICVLVAVLLFEEFVKGHSVVAAILQPDFCFVNLVLLDLALSCSARAAWIPKGTS